MKNYLNKFQRSWVAAGAAVVGAGVSIYKGIKQKQQANGLLQKQRPIEEIPQEQQANELMAQNMATEGLPSQQYQQAIKNIQRQQMSSLRQAQDRRSGVANIGAIQQGSNDALGNLGVADSEARRQNQLGLINVNNQVSQWRGKVFDWNQKQNYLQNRAYGMSLLGAGNANIYGGLDKGLAGAGTAIAGGGFNGLFSGGSGSGSGSGGAPSYGVAPSYDESSMND